MSVLVENYALQAFSMIAAIFTSPHCVLLTAAKIMPIFSMVIQIFTDNKPTDIMEINFNENNYEKVSKDGLLCQKIVTETLLYNHRFF